MTTPDHSKLLMIVVYKCCIYEFHSYQFLDFRISIFTISVFNTNICICEFPYSRNMCFSIYEYLFFHIYELRINKFLQLRNTVVTNFQAKNSIFTSLRVKTVEFAQRWIFLRKTNISAHPQKWPCTGIQGHLVTGQYYFCTKPKKGNFSAHNSNISARIPKKGYFYAQSNMKLTKSAQYNIFQCFANIFMI